MRYLTKSRDRKLLGVAGGFAEYTDLDPTVWRAIWILACIVMPPAILAYFILGLVMPDAPGGQPHQPPEPEPSPRPMPQPRVQKRMTRSRDRWLSGVAAGIAEYFEVDPVLVRALFLGAFFLGGGGLWVYIVLAILMPGPER
jgi:phage shock protein C